MGNSNSHSKQSSSFRQQHRHERHVSSSTSSKNSSTTNRNQSPLTTVSSFNVHQHEQQSTTPTILPQSTTIVHEQQQQQHNPDVMFAASHALIGIGAASSSHCSLSNNNYNQQTPSSPVLSSSINTSFNVFPLQHVDSDMTSMTTSTTSVRNSRTALSTSIHISDIPTTIHTHNTVMQTNTPPITSSATTSSINNINTTTPTNETSNLKSRQSLPPSSTQQQTARLQQENTGYRRSLSTPKLSLLKKKNVLKAFFMLHRRNTLDEAEMKGEEEFGRRVTDGEDFIPMQNVSTQIVDLSPPIITHPQHRPRVHSMTSAITSDSSSSATRAGDTDTDTTIAAEVDEKKKIASILNKSFSKTRNIIKSQPHSHVETPSADHGKIPADRKNLERSASAPSIMTNELEILLRDAMGFQLFKDFCVAEFSVENLNCWQELLDMEKNFIDMSGKRRSKVINMVYDKFLDDGCSEEINIRGKTKKLVDTERKSGTINLDTSKHLLHEIKRDLYTNLVDSFSRFIYTDEYKLWHELKTNPSNVFE